MKPIAGEIKFFEANITHQRNGKKNHFFNNKTNAVLIDLKNKSQQKIPKYPSLFSIKNFNLLTWSASKHGSQYEFSTSNDLYKFIIDCDNQRKPLIGCCFGHQAIAVALGGDVEKSSIDWNVGVEKTKYTNFKSWMTPEFDQNLYFFHEDQVTKLPNNCTLLGSTDNCPISSFSKGNHIFTTQSHPEIDFKFMDTLVDKYQSLVGPLIYEKAKQSLTKKIEGKQFAIWCEKFIKYSL